ncbi:lipopolysaccharide biosynthesis protein [Sandarakinorhabdus sp.]|uniref:lipopolysaccharide biosynthesis protein n=1 Tax=Sandarakinorhabdus sp. TaxID=1916663 RepID=UPI003F70C1A8
MSKRPGGPAGGLGRHAIPGVVTQILSRSARALVGLGTVVVLSRYLAPSEFGLFALIFFFVSFAQILGDSGIRAALVVRQQPSVLEEDSIFWLSVALGLVLTLATIAFSEPLARLFNEPNLASPLRQSAWVFLLNSFRGVPLSQLERGFQFNKIALAEITAAVVGAVVAIALALAGEGVLALVAQQLAMAAVPSLMNLRAARYVPGLQFSFAAVRPLLGLGGSLTLAGMVQFLAGNIDRPIVGARLSAADLGVLAVAQQVVGTPLRMIVANVRRVTFPILASIQTENSRILAAHMSSLHAVMLVLGPVCFGLSAVSAPATRVLLGPQWIGAGDVVAIASITALMTSMGELNQAVFASKGRAGYMLRWSIGALITNSLLLWLLVPYGLMAIVLGRLAYVIAALPLGAYFLSRELECRVRDLLLCFWRPLLASFLMGAAVLAVDRLWLAELASELVRLLVLVPVGGVIFAAAIWLVDRTMVRTLVARVRAVRSKAGPKPAAAGGE